MKTPLALLAALLALVHGDAFAQGRLSFQFTYSFADEAAVALGVTPGTIPTRTLMQGFQAGLYFAPNTGGDVTSMTLLTTLNLAETGQTPGRYTETGLVLPGLPAGSANWFQVRIWESAYGNSYDGAAAAGPLNGRRAIIGQSTLHSATVPDTIPTTPLNFGNIQLNVVPEPSVTALLLLGLAGLVWKVRRAN